MAFKPVTHVLFDMDGLILNTEELYTIGFEDIASRYGKTFTFELKSKIMGQQSIEKLIHHLHNNKVPIGLATSSSKETYDMKVAHHLELFDLLEYKTWGSSDPLVKKGKPHPDIFLVAASKFPDNPAPEQCLVFEDSLNGVIAGRAAGMQVVMVPDPRLARGRAAAAGATLVLDSAEHFRPELFGLPPF